MKNKIIMIIFLLALVTAPFAYAGTTDEARLLQFFDSGMAPEQQEIATEIARVVTNDELLKYVNDEYYQKIIMEGKRLNPLNFTEYAVLAYGDRYGTFAIGEYRYLGYTAKEEAYTNVFFRPDFADGIQIDQANWIETPWKDDIVKYFLKQMKEPQLENNSFNNQPIYRDSILLGFTLLNQLYPDYYGLNYEETKDRDWEKYVQILQPPSKYCLGTGRMFRQLPDGSLRYMDVPLISFSDAALDFSVFLEKDSYQAKPGEVIETTVIFELNKDFYKPREAKLRLYLETANEEIEIPFTPVDPSKKLNGDKYTFKPGEKLTVKFSFAAPPGGKAEIVSQIDGTFIKGVTWVEKNSDDNEDRAPLIMDQYDIMVEVRPERDSYTALNGGTTGVNFIISVTRKDALPGEIKATGNINGAVGRFPLSTILGPGESKESKYGFPASPGSYTVEADAWPNGFDDVIPEDNRDAATVTVENQVFKPDSKLRVDLIDGGPIYR